MILSEQDIYHSLYYYLFYQHIYSIFYILQLLIKLTTINTFSLYSEFRLVVAKGRFFFFSFNWDRWENEQYLYKGHATSIDTRKKRKKEKEASSVCTAIQQGPLEIIYNTHKGRKKRRISKHNGICRYTRKCDLCYQAANGTDESVSFSTQTYGITAAHLDNADRIEKPEPVTQEILRIVRYSFRLINQSVHLSYRKPPPKSSFSRSLRTGPVYRERGAQALLDDHCWDKLPGLQRCS